MKSFTLLSRGRDKKQQFHLVEYRRNTYMYCKPLISSLSILSKWTLSISVGKQLQ
jgi:hypothetical protein